MKQYIQVFLVDPCVVMDADPVGDFPIGVPIG